MRRKIAKRLKKKLEGLGCKIEKVEFVKEPGWKRKDCGYSISIKYKGWTVVCIGHDELICYRIMLDDVLHWDEMLLPERKENNDGSC